MKKNGFYSDEEIFDSLSNIRLQIPDFSDEEQSEKEILHRLPDLTNMRKRTNLQEWGKITSNVAAVLLLCLLAFQQLNDSQNKSLNNKRNTESTSFSIYNNKCNLTEVEIRQNPAKLYQCYLDNRIKQQTFRQLIEKQISKIYLKNNENENN